MLGWLPLKFGLFSLQLAGCQWLRICIRICGGFGCLKAICRALKSELKHATHFDFCSCKNWRMSCAESPCVSCRGICHWELFDVVHREINEKTSSERIVCNHSEKWNKELKKKHENDESNAVSFLIRTYTNSSRILIRKLTFVPCLSL